MSMKKIFRIVTTSLVCTAIFGFIGCSDMLSKLDGMHWGTTYTVRHLLQDLNRDKNGVEEGRYTEDTYERETLPNTVPNTLTEAKAKTIPGFTPRAFEQVIVDGDGNTTIDIYYDRKEVTLTFKANGGYFITENQSKEPTKTLTQFYGTEASLPKPRYDKGSSDIEVSFYDFVPVQDDLNTSPLNPKDSDSRINFSVPATDGTYQALWDVRASIDKFVGSSIQIPSGKLNVTGEATSGNLKALVSQVKANNTKQIELNLKDLKPESDSLVFGGGSEDSQFADNPALTKVELPATGKIELGNNAFKQCTNLTSITIGSNVTEVSGSAFWGCHKLEFDVDPNHPTLIAVQDKKALLREEGDKAYTLVSYPSATGTIDLGKLGYTITTIGTFALAGLHHETITLRIPPSVKKIESWGTSQSDYGKLLTIIMEGTTPPELPGEEQTFSTLGVEVEIYVPDDNLEDYKKGWVNYEGNISPMSAYKPE